MEARGHTTILRVGAPFYTHWAANPSPYILTRARNSLTQTVVTQNKKLILWPQLDRTAPIFIFIYYYYHKNYFYNKFFAELPTSWLKIVDQNDLTSNSFAINPKAGDIILFPSYMLHGVTMHKINQKRTTVAFNLSLQWNSTPTFN